MKVKLRVPFWNTTYQISVGVIGKHIPYTKLWPGYGLARKIMANPYPGYSLAMIYVCQTIPWVEFGYNLHTPKHYWVWFGCYTGQFWKRTDMQTTFLSKIVGLASIISHTNSWRNINLLCWLKYVSAFPLPHSNFICWSWLGVSCVVEM